MNKMYWHSIARIAVERTLKLTAQGWHEKFESERELKLDLANAQLVAWFSAQPSNNLKLLYVELVERGVICDP